MTPDEFMDLAAGIGPDVQRKPVLDTVQYRVGAKVFATLGWPAEGWAVVKLNAGDQRRALAASNAFAREPGRRRNSGVTLIHLKTVDRALLAEVLGAAWRQAYLGSCRAGAAHAASGAQLDAG
ncbi:hypothetical protein BH10PSE4_BH10PSE4_45510 [soil metagenome]